MPPAPPAEKMRVAARPARLICSEAFMVDAPADLFVLPRDHPLEEHHVGTEAGDGGPDGDHHPVPLGAVDALEAALEPHHLREEHVDGHHREDDGQGARGELAPVSEEGLDPRDLLLPPRRSSRARRRCPPSSRRQPRQPVGHRDAERLEPWRQPARCPRPGRSRRAGRPRSALRGRRARSPASAHRPMPPRRDQAPPAGEGARPSPRFRSEATASQQRDCLRANCRAASRRGPRPARRSRP